MATMLLAPLARVGGMTLALALAAGTAKAQFPGSPPGKTLPPAPPAAPVALPRDLVALYTPPPAIAESYSSDQPCVTHNHTHTSFVKLRRVLATPLPTGTKATLYKDGQAWMSWDVVTQTGSTNEPIVLGSFTWTKTHVCGTGYSVNFVPGNPPNYRLVVDPGNQIAEASESNNSVEFYIDPSASWVKKP